MLYESSFHARNTFSDGPWLEDEEIMLDLISSL